MNDAALAEAMPQLAAELVAGMNEQKSALAGKLWNRKRCEPGNDGRWKGSAAS
jgi:hypothetical protein